MTDLKVIVGIENPGLVNCSRKGDVEYKIKNYTIHPEFDYPYFDVGVLELESTIKYTKGISSVCLSLINSTDYLTGKSVSLFGWGANTIEKHESGVASKLLRGTHQMRITSESNCRHKIDSPSFDYKDLLYVSVFNRNSWLKPTTSNKEKSMDGLLCAEDSEPDGLLGSCGGDSGSPVVERTFHQGRRRYEQIGIVSGGICNDKDTPTVLTHIGHNRVYEFISNSKFGT